MEMFLKIMRFIGILSGKLATVGLLFTIPLFVLKLVGVVTIGWVVVFAPFAIPLSVWLLTLITLGIVWIIEYCLFNY